MSMTNKKMALKKSNSNKKVFFDRYIFQETISITNFSTVCKCIDKKNNKVVIAKIIGDYESEYDPESIEHENCYRKNLKHAKNEYVVLKKLQTIGHHKSDASNNVASSTKTTDHDNEQIEQHAELCGFPALYGFEQKDACFYIFMQPFKMNFQQLFNKCNRFFSEETLYFITCQMFDLIEKVHSCGYVHRDIKPSNMCLESMSIDEYSKKTGNSSFNKKKEVFSVSIIDFGLSKSFLQKNKTHIHKTKQKGFTGNPKFASINALKNLSPSRMDDIEAILYVILYFSNSNCKLPWESSDNDKVDNDSILEKKYIFRAYIRDCLEDEIKLNIPNFLLEIFKITFDPKYEQNFGIEPPYDQYYEVLGQYSNELSEGREFPIETLGDLKLSWEDIDLS